MHNDTRERNEYFGKDSIFLYLRDYANKIKDGLDQLDLTSLYNRLNYVHDMRGRIFAGGNGGSAAISDHLACDFEKGCNLRTHSLIGRTALFTAIANDLGYENTLLYQLAKADLCSRDCVLLVSSSGNSANILKAAEYTKKQGACLIGFTGFDGGELKKMADISIHIPIHNYGVVEDCHQAAIHVIAQYRYLRIRE